MKNKTVSKSDCDKILKMCASNEKSLASIAELFGIHVGTIHRIQKRAGVKVERRPNHKFTRELKQQIISDYKNGIRTAKLAEKYNSSSNTIRKILREGGVEVTAVKQWSESEIKSIVKIYKEGQNIAAIAKKYKTAHYQISCIISREVNFFPRRGEYNSKWKGGRHIDDRGYVKVRVDVTNKIALDTANKRFYILEHRLIMAEHLGRPLDRRETVHHINGIRTDNRIENLQLRQGNHGNGVNYCCLDCGSNNVRPVELK